MSRLTVFVPVWLDEWAEMSAIVHDGLTEDEMSVVSMLTRSVSNFGVKYDTLLRRLQWEEGRLQDTLNSLIEKGDIDRMMIRDHTFGHPYGDPVERFIVHHPVV